MRGKGKGELLWISLLGAPIFFIICINHLTEGTTGQAFECANDNKLGSIINDGENQTAK